jgi:hypothetical protein
MSSYAVLTRGRTADPTAGGSHPQVVARPRSSCVGGQHLDCYLEDRRWLATDAAMRSGAD